MDSQSHPGLSLNVPSKMPWHGWSCQRSVETPGRWVHRHLIRVFGKTALFMAVHMKGIKLDHSGVNSNLWYNYYSNTLHSFVWALSMHDNWDKPKLCEDSGFQGQSQEAESGTSGSMQILMSSNWNSEGEGRKLTTMLWKTFWLSLPRAINLQFPL